MADARPEAPRRDLLQTLRDSFDQLERQLNELLSERSAGERASSFRARMQEWTLGLQRRNWENWARYFQSINLPTRTDVIRLGKRIAELEQALGRVEVELRAIGRRLGSAEDPVRPAPRPVSGVRPRRTRQPPAQAER